MSRSVFVPWGAVNVAYAAFECSDCPEEFSDSLVNAEYALREKYPSLEAARGWIGNEGRVFLENSFARIVVAEYCGLVSISAVPTGNPLAPAWCAKLDLDCAAECFGPVLRKLGSASNGEAFFKPADGVERGELGLGFTSKEGWL